MMTKKNILMIACLILILGISGFSFSQSHNTVPSYPFVELQGFASPQFLYAIYGTKAKKGLFSSKKMNSSFNRPLAVLSVSGGHLYVADTGNSRIMELGPDGERLRTFGEGSLNYPFALAYSGQKLYVADPNLMKIAVFDRTGKEQSPLISEMSLPLPNGKKGDVIRPTALQIGNDGLFYIADVGNQCIVVLDGNGNYIRHFGSAGKNNGQFQYPNALAFGPEGKLYVSDSNNGRVQIFNSNGDFLTKITGGRLGPLSLPRGIVVDENGTIFIVDVFLHSVRAFDDAGNELWNIGGMGINNGEFQFPNGIAMDSSGLIYVTDRENNRLQVFGYSN